MRAMVSAVRPLALVFVLTALALVAGEPAPPAFAGADLQGDANCSGTVDTVDALTVLRQGAGLANAPCAELADVQCDGDIDAIDALQLLRWGAGLSVSQQPGCTLIGEATGPPPTSYDLIEQAVDDGDLDEGTGLVYQFYAAFNDPRLPSEYSGDDSNLKDLPLRSKLAAMWPGLSQAERDLILPFMRTPPEPDSWYSQNAGRIGAAGIEWDSLASGSHPVKIWWETRFPGDEARAASLMAALDTKIWGKLTDLMGTDPLPDCGAACPSGGGDPRLDIYLVGPSVDANYTWWNPPDTVTCETTPTYITLLPGASPATLAHEFMHALQFALPYANGDGCSEDWWWESTATWAEEFVWRDEYNPDQHSFAPLYLDTTHQPIEEVSGNRHYGAYVFPYYLDEIRGKPNLVPEVFSRMGSEADSLKAVESVVGAGLGGFEEAWKDFTLKNWNGDPVTDYRDMDSLMPGALPVAQQVGVGETEIDEAEVEHLAAVYMKFTFADGVHTVVFKNTLAGVDHAGVMALKKVDGEWQDPEDWSSESEKKFCLDRPSEKLDELIIIFSNSDAVGGNKLNPSDLPTIEGKPDGCSGFEGTVTVHGVDGYGVVVNATATGVRFEPQEGFSNLGLVAGRATWTASGTDSFGCGVSGTAQYDFSSTDDIQGAGFAADFQTGEYYVEIVLNTGDRKKQHSGCPPPYDYLNGDQIWVNSLSLIPFRNNSDYMLHEEGEVRVAEDSFSQSDFEGFESVTYSWRLVEYGTTP